MAEPTQEQVKELWEGYELNYCRKCRGEVTADIKPGRCNCHTPELIPIDLNNLFKVVPENSSLEFNDHYRYTVGYFCRIKTKTRWYDGYGETYTLALFWALKKMKEKA